MALDWKFPIILKIFFPPLFVLEWYRHYFHKSLISHSKYWEAGKEMLDVQAKEILDFATSLPTTSPVTILEFGCGPRPTYDAFPINVNLILVEPCVDFNEEIYQSWNNSKHSK